MKLNQSLIAAAVSGLVAATAMTAFAHAADDKKADAKEAKEKCYGVAKKGQNDCGTAKHSCAGQAASDNLAEEWKFVAKGSCEKMGGKLKTAEKKKSDPPPSVPYP